MSPRKIVRGLLTALLAGAAGRAQPGLAHAGGPTSVLIVEPERHSAPPACTTPRLRYEELARAIGGEGDQPSELAQQTRECRPRRRTGGSG